jgi:hypothetical protein
METKDPQTTIHEPRSFGMKIDGGCHCGNITFVAEIDPEKVVICHCTDCQNLTGAPYRVVIPAPKEGFKVSGGKLKSYVKKTAESGTPRVQAFCPECGTPIYSTSVADQQTFGLRIGTIRQRARLSPKKQIWCRSALEWAMDIRALPQSEKQGTHLTR